MTMLKAVVFSLLFLNVVYFLWARDVVSLQSEPPVRLSGPSLKLASEVPGLTHADDAGDDGAGGADGSGSAGNKALLTNVARCITVGPFRDVAEAARAATTLRGSGYEPRQRVADGEVSAGVWVYLPKPESFTVTENVLGTLRKAGIDDALEMPGPNDTPVISLGIFNEPKRAQNRVTRAQTLGYKPVIADRKRQADMYWVDVSLKPTDALITPADLHPEAGHIMRLEVKACPAAPNT
jgi:hypothetical protein